MPDTIENRVQAVWKRIETWLTANAPSELEKQFPSATEADIEEIEATLGVTFTEEVRASYRIHGGRRYMDGGMLPTDLLPLEMINAEWEVWYGLLNQGTFAEFKSEPEPGIKPYWWSPKWIPITWDGSGNNYCLDFDPASGGQVGQVITLWHDTPGREIVAPNLLEWLEAFADALEEGQYTLHEDYEGLVHIDDI